MGAVAFNSGMRNVVRGGARVKRRRLMVWRWELCVYTLNVMQRKVCLYNCMCGDQVQRLYGILCGEAGMLPSLNEERVIV